MYGIVSLRALRVHWALHELDLPYRTEPVESRSGQTTTDSYTAMDPRQKIPALDDEGFILTESPAIVTYLAERYGAGRHGLIPACPFERARYFEWLSFASMELDATSLYVLRRHEGLPAIYGEAPVATRAARGYFDKMIRAAATRYSQAGSGPYLLGGAFSGADIVMTTCLIGAARLGLTVPEPLAGYHNRTTARRAFTAALAANRSPPAPAL